MEFDDTLSRFIDTKEFQRLRHIKQLGISYIVFPGAVHTRFSHSLGVAFIMQKVLSHLEANCNLLLSKYDKITIILGALLHDIGHGPMSHLFESIEGCGSHETWCLEILNSLETEVGRLISNFNFKEGVLSILTKTYPEEYITDLISGPLDVDRMDYLLRDSYYTGTHYGYFDLEWLIYSMDVQKKEEKKIITINGRRGLRALEGYFWARMSMFNQVYFHKSARSGEFMLKLIIKRVINLLREGGIKINAPSFIVKVAEQKKPSVKELLEMDDNVIWYYIKEEWSKAKDKILADLSQRLLKRNLFKTVIVENEDKSIIDELYKKVKECTKELGYEPEYYCGVDKAETIPYKIEVDGMEKIWISIGKEVKPVIEVSPLISAMKNIKIEQNLMIMLAEVRTKLGLSKVL